AVHHAMADAGEARARDAVGQPAEQEVERAAPVADRALERAVLLGARGVAGREARRRADARDLPARDAGRAAVDAELEARGARVEHEHVVGHAASPAPGAAALTARAAAGSTGAPAPPASRRRARGRARPPRSARRAACA